MYRPNRMWWGGLLIAREIPRSRLYRPTTPPAEEFRPIVRVARHSSAIIITEVPHSVDTDEPDLRPPVRASPGSARIPRAVTEHATVAKVQ